MNRRRLLTSVGLGIGVAVAGCSSTGQLSSLSGPSPDEFSQCEKLVIRIPTLPEPAREEVEVALTDGQYESEDELYLPHVMPISESYLGETGGDPGQDYGTLSNQNVTQHYRAVVTEDEAVNRLELEPAIPSWGTGSISVENNASESQSVDISIERLRDSEIVVSETVSVPADARTETDSFEQMFGSYRAEVTTDEFSDQFEWHVGEFEGPLTAIMLDSDGISVRPVPTLEPVYCKGVWENPSTEE